MSRRKWSSCWYLVFGLVLAFMVLFAGCQRKKERTGKYNEEEMASIPLAQRSDLPPPSGGLALSVNTETITIDDIVSPLMDTLASGVSFRDYEAFREQIGKGISRMVLEKVREILLYQKARKKAPPDIDERLDAAVENAVNRFVAGYGGNWAQAQAAIEQEGFDWQSFRDYQKKLMITQSYMSQELSEDRPVGYSEMLEYYDKIKHERLKWEGLIEFRLIDIVESELDMSGYAGLSARGAAWQLANELIERIGKGEDFGELAGEYSQGHRAAMGGLWTPVSEGAGLVEPYDIIETTAWQMEPGDVRGPLEKGGHVFILKLEKKKDAGMKSFAEVQSAIESEILFVRRRVRYEELMVNLVDRATIANMEVFVDHCVREAYRRYIIQSAQAGGAGTE